jgi:hypothetical protein
LRETEKEAAIQAAAYGHLDIVKYLVEERKTTDQVKFVGAAIAAGYGRLDCLKYLVEEARAPINHSEYIAGARYFERLECVNYLREKGCEEPTDEEYARFAEDRQLFRQHLEERFGGMLLGL